MRTCSLVSHDERACIQSCRRRCQSLTSGCAAALTSSSVSHLSTVSRWTCCALGRLQTSSRRHRRWVRAQIDMDLIALPPSYEFLILFLSFWAVCLRWYLLWLFLSENACTCSLIGPCTHSFTLSLIHPLAHPVTPPFPRWLTERLDYRRQWKKSDMLSSGAPPLTYQTLHIYIHIYHTYISAMRCGLSLILDIPVSCYMEK